MCIYNTFSLIMTLLIFHWVDLFALDFSRKTGGWGVWWSGEKIPCFSSTRPRRPGLDPIIWLWKFIQNSKTSDDVPLGWVCWGYLGWWNPQKARDLSNESHLKIRMCADFLHRKVVPLVINEIFGWFWCQVCTSVDSNHQTKELKSSSFLAGFDIITSSNCQEMT